MSKLVQSISIHSVPDLYKQYGRLAKAYSQDDNPLARITHSVPARAEYFVIVPKSDEVEAQKLMNRIRGRRTLRRVEGTKEDFRYGPFSDTGEMVILYA